MKVTLNEIEQAFDLIINEKKSREDIALWAIKFQSAEDNGKLEYDPPSEEDKIWDGIQYLTGVDLLDNDRIYFHSVKNFVDFRDENGL